MEVVKFQQAALINSDLDMYYARTDTPALCRTSSLVEELGQIEFIFSDKTGTLTRNEMEFKCASIGGVVYAEEVDDSRKADEERDGEGVKDSWRTFDDLRRVLEGTGTSAGLPTMSGKVFKNPFDADAIAMSDGTAVLREREVAHEFMTLLAVCHTVIPEVRDGKTHYQASSPDEAALVAGAELLGYQFHVRGGSHFSLLPIDGVVDSKAQVGVCQHPGSVGRVRSLERVRVQFDAKAHVDGRARTGRQDQAVLQRRGHGHSRAVRQASAVYRKDALSTRSSSLPLYSSLTCVTDGAQDYATDGLRTLCIAYRDIPPAEYTQWAAIHTQAAATINGRGEALDQAAELIEKDMFLLGATAIEDKLQEGVPDAIHTLQEAGIKVWVLTGDRQETAINIGMSCRLIGESMNLVIVNEESAHDTAEFISKRLSAIKNQGEQEDLALIIGARCFSFMGSRRSHDVRRT